MAPWRARNQAAVSGDSTRHPQRLKKWLAGTLSAALGLGMLAGVATKAYAEELITGTVFRDFNANGKLDGTDRGLKDVTVTAFNAAGDAIKSVKTDKDGLYTLSVPNGQPVRVEFSEWDPHYHPTSAAQAGTNGTSVQFVMPGSAGVDFSLNAPEDFVQDEEVSVIGSIMTASEADDGATSWRNSVYGLAWESHWAAANDDRPTSTTKPGKSSQEVDLGSNSKTGSLWGSAYDRVGNNAYVSASLKRQAGLGPLGLGGIYQVPNVLKADNSVNSGTSVQPWLDVEGLQIVGGDTIKLGVEKLENRLAIPKPGTPYADPIAYEQAGKIGIGGLEATPDGKYLIFTNLYDRNLYALDLTAGTPTEAIRIPLNLPDGERPWAVTVYRDKLYVGTVQTGERDPGDLTPPVQASDYNAFVKSVAIDEVLYGGSGGTFALELTVPLGYTKGQASGDGTRGDISNKWHTWTDLWNWDGGSVASPQPNSNDGWHSFPQAILSEIEFDVDGYMTMAFLDRTSIQSAVRNYASDADVTGDTRLYNTQSGGDLLIAALDDEGDWKLENNGKVGDRQGTQHATANQNQGPGGHEFYRDMQNMSSVGGNGSNHQEIGLGGLASHPGQNKVGATVYDPRVVVNTSGLNWFNSADGFATHGIDLDVGPSSVRTAGPYNENNISGFGKGGGLGDIVSILRAAPVEIGNRTWLDLDGDGIQDAGEPSITGVEVELWAADEDGNPTGDAPIATKTTDASGTYYFRSDVDGFNATGDYVVVFKPGSTGDVDLNWHGATAPAGFVEPTWPQVTFTDQGAGDVDPSVELDADNARRDSNPNPLTGNAPVTVNGPGKNNHTVDAGWRYGTVSVGNYVWVDEDRSGTQDAGEPGIEGVLFEIFLVDVADDGTEIETELTTDVFGNPFENNRTDEHGKYIFENLPVLTGSQYYKVQIVADDAQTAQALEIYEPTDPGIGEDREVDSNTGFATTQDIPADQALTQHGREDMSLDFGFVKLVPSAVILKNDGENEADVPGDAVDLTTPGSAAGTTPLKFQVRNTSVEPLHDVVVTDKVVEGDAKIVGLVCEFETGTQTPGVYDEASNKWTVTWANSFADAEVRQALPVGGTFACTATLTGVVGDHKNVATITGTGAKSGETVQEKPFDPANPESPGTDNPFHAKRTPAVSVGDRVWEDTINPDLGIQDLDDDGNYLEPGIDGVVLEIVGPDGEPVKSVVTGENVPNQTTENGGFYKFEDLPVLGEGESYTVRIVTVPAEYKPTTQGTDNGSGEFDSSTGQSSSVEDLTTHGQHDPTLDFGFVKKTPGAEVIKTDGNGRDANTAAEAVDVGPSGGETEINFTVVNNGEEALTNIGLVDVISEGSGALQYPISCEIVDADPAVKFNFEATDDRWDGLLPVGSTLLCETTLTGVEPGESHLNTVTLLAEGENTKKPVEDPNNPGNPPTDPFNAKYKTYAIGDYVWIDSNPNGVQDEGEQPYKDGTDVRLWKLDEDGNRVGTHPVATTTTNSDGYYLFDSLVAGDYQVEFKLPSEYLWTTATPGEDGTATNDSNAVWTDDDQEWAASIGITLNDSSPLTPWNDAAGNKEGEASEGIDQTWDAGLVKRVPNATIDKSDEDRNTADDGDPVVDLGADGATGIVFTIVNTGAEPLKDIGLADVTTSGSGDVQYPIVLTQPDGTPFNLDSADATWPGPLARGATVTGHAQLTGVKPGEAHRNVVTLHAKGALTGDPVLRPDPENPDEPGIPPTNEYNGRVPSYAIGDYVWIDANRNGIQDAGEKPVAGMTVNLLDAAGNAVRDENGDPVTTTTDANGYYLFDNLVEGGYRVQFVLPEGEYRWTENVDGDESTDNSDAKWNNSDDKFATTDVIALGKNSPLTPWAEADGKKDGQATEGIDQTWDAGLVLRTYAIGDVVWIDRNEDGKQDDGESPIAGVVVNLLDGQGKPILDADDNPVTTETDANGRYLFDELPKGEYIVEFELPDGHRWTTANATGEGVTDENNSDAVHDTPTSATARTGVIKLGNDKVDPNYTDRTDWTATEGVDPTWDGGVVPLKVSVGDYVWVDDGDGVQNDGDDSGLNGVTLSLQVERADGTIESVVDVWKKPVGPTTTADKDGKPGYYEFKDLPVLKDGESYIVTISNVPDKYKPTKEGTDNGSGADDSSTDTATSVKPLDKDGLRDPTLDFGFVLKTPSGTVNKSDADKNDANTAGEAVDLGPVGGETTIVFTIKNNGEEPLTNIGLADATVTGGGTLVYPIVLTLPDGSTYELDNAAARWDGTLEVGDSITGTAQLTDVEEGRGSHQNVVTLWAEGKLTGKPVADPDDPGTPENPNRPNDPYNAEKLTYAIGDYVWVDRNKNGQQDAGEEPIEGVRVNLLDGDGNLITDADGNAVYTETDEHGLYFFDRLPAGTYVVEFKLPDGYRFTTQNAEGVGHASNSDAHVTTGRTGPVVLGPSNTNLDRNYAAQSGWNATEGLDPTLDAGVIPESVSVGDFVWHDLNDNGIQDDGEPGIEKVTLTLTGPDGQPVTNVYGELVDPVETDGAGHYVFEDLPVLGEGESYTVKISDVPAKYKPAKPGEGDDPAKDSSTGSETSKPLTKDGDEDMTLDFGFVLKTPGADVVKADVEGRDANSASAPADLSSTKGKIDIEFTIVNGGEEPITNIALVDETTAGSGTVGYPLVCTPSIGDTFKLDNRSDSIWMVDGQPGVLDVGETITCVGTLDGVVAGDPHTDVVTLWADGVHTGKPVVDPEDPGTPENPNRPNDPYNAVVKTYAIGDYVWIDELNPNGIQDEGEPGIAGVIVTLFDENGDQVGDSVTTDDDGYYQFDNLEPGKYTVKFDLPTGYVLVPENEGDDRGLDSDAIASDPSRTSGSTVQVTLDDTNKALVERDGVNATEGIDPTWDAGVRKYTFAIGDVVWIDRNEDGKQDDGEPRIEGVVVNLLDGKGNPIKDANGKPVSTETDANGLYLFDELPQGDYIVEFELPDGYYWTTANATGAGVTDENNSDAVHDTPNSAIARTGVITLGNDKVDPDYSDQTGWKATQGVDPTWDAGVVPASVWVGDLVWFDTNGNGIQDDNEPGIDGAVLTLTGPDGKPVKNVYGETVPPYTTGPDGHYEFKDLPVLKPGQSYTVTVTAPDEYKPTKENQGGDPAKDSSTGSAKSGDLTENGASDPTLDFGFVKKQPGGTVVKTDGVNDANTADKAVDLGPAGGTTPIEFTITNTGEEPITNIGLVDVSTGSGVVDYPFTCVAPGNVKFTLANSDARWDGQLAVGDEIVCSATLSGVVAGQPHTNVVTLWAKGSGTGDPVQDPDNPGTPEKPNRPSDPYNAVVKTYAIGDVVWIDKNKNGQQDAGEKPIEGVTVNLLNSEGRVVATTKTDKNGLYLFDNLVAGEYTVEFKLPDGYRFTTQNAEGVPAGANSDANVTTGRTGSIKLGNNAVTKNYTAQDWTATEGVDPTWDAGVVPESVSVGDYVWHDLNGNGVQDAGEPGIQNVTLTLTGPDGKPVTNVYGEPVKPVQTDANGKYVFTDLPVLGNGEKYTVTISNVPDKFKPTKPGVGDPAKDSSTGSATSGSLTKDGAEDMTLDFGFVLKDPGAVIVKMDEKGRDGNSSTDPVDLTPERGTIDIDFTVVNNGDEPITNIGLVDQTTAGSGKVNYPLTCEVFDAKGAKTDSFTLTGANDRWRKPVSEAAVQSESDDSASSVEDGQPVTEEANASEDTTVTLASVESFGVLGIGESIRCTGTLSGVVAGKPHTDVVTLWADGVHTKKPVVDPANPGTPEKPNRPSDPYNAAVKSYAIGDYVWIDQLHPNGVQDADEPGLPGVTVVLLDEQGNKLATTTTGPDGYYQFDNLAPGTYQVRFELPAGYVLIAPDQGNDDTVDSDALPIAGTNGTQGKTILVTLDDTNNRLVKRPGVNATEGIDPTWDAGVRMAKVTVGDYVWKDTNRDGLQGDPADEPGIPGVVLTIERSDGKPVTNVYGEPVGPTTTDSNGKYEFTDLPLLPEGVHYTVKIDREKSKDALGDLAPTTPGVGNDPGRDSSTWQENATGLKHDGDKDLTLDFGFVEPSVTVGDRVWEDSNKDGRQNAGEPGIPGVVVEIFGPDGKPVTDVFGNPVGPVTTDEHGNYLFPNLPALKDGQSYTVKIDKEASADALKGFEPTKPGVGDRAGDSSTWEATTEGLTSHGDKDLTLDFGFVRPSVTVGDKVWNDINRDGRQDPGEPGIPGVVVEIFGPDGEPVTDVYGNPVGPVTTDSNGKYEFTDLPILPEGQSYTVKINVEKSKDALGNKIPTKPGVGDREGDSSNWEESTKGLNADGDKDLTLDFGFVTPSVTVGDKVWLDKNGNGRQDFGEKGIPGVVLNIVGPDGKPVTDVYGNPVKSVTTDSKGNYLFENLPALPEGQSYKVLIDREASAEALKGLKPTTEGVGDRKGDSSTWESTTEGLNADGDEDLTLDFGFVVDDSDDSDGSGSGSGSGSGDKPGGLPQTGTNSVKLLLWSAVALLLAGSALVWRRRLFGNTQ